MTPSEYMSLIPIQATTERGGVRGKENAMLFLIVVVVVYCVVKTMEDLNDLF